MLHYLYNYVNIKFYEIIYYVGGVYVGGHTFMTSARAVHFSDPLLHPYFMTKRTNILYEHPLLSWMMYHLRHADPMH